MIMNKINVFCDGGARGNPGPAGIGVVVVDNSGREKCYHKYIGHKTNNQAEYEAVLFALQNIKKDYPGVNEVNFFLDSELVVNQIEGKYKIKNEGLGKLLIMIHNKIINSDLKIDFKYIPREKNHHADRLVNAAIDEARKRE